VWWGDDPDMKKALVVAAVLAVLGGLGRLLGSRMQNIDWEKRIDALPGNAPPKWMFRNITSIRENTERILRLLESERSGPAQPVPAQPTPDTTPPTRGLIRTSERPKAFRW
jgi:hypothetical protein